jgi:hypothetical protein
MKRPIRLWWAVDDQGVPYLVARRRGRTRALFGWQHNLYRLWRLYRERCLE